VIRAVREAAARTSRIYAPRGVAEVLQRHAITAHPLLRCQAAFLVVDAVVELHDAFVGAEGSSVRHRTSIARRLRLLRLPHLRGDPLSRLELARSHAFLLGEVADDGLEEVVLGTGQRALLLARLLEAEHTHDMTVDGDSVRVTPHRRK